MITAAWLIAIWFLTGYLLLFLAEIFPSLHRLFDIFPKTIFVVTELGKSLGRLVKR